MMTKLSKILSFLLFAFAFLFLTGNARAQSVIVNSQSMDLSAREEGWMAQSRLAVSFATGNVEKLSVGFNLKVQHQSVYPDHGEHQVPWLKERWLILGSLAGARAGETGIEDQGLAHLRWTRMWIRRLGHELFVQSRFNEFLRLRHRALVGAGARFDFLNHKEWLGWMGSAYMFEYNSIVQSVRGDDERITLEHRWSSYLALRKIYLEDRFLAQLTAFVQPRFDQLSDLRVFATLELVAKMGDHLGLGMTAGWAYDSRPPQQVEESDLRLLSTLSFSL